MGLRPVPRAHRPGGLRGRLRPRIAACRRQRLPHRRARGRPRAGAHRPALARRQLRVRVPLARRHRTRVETGRRAATSRGTPSSRTPSGPRSSSPTAGWLGAAPYLNLNVSTGTVDEALGWVEYCNGRDPLPEARPPSGRASPRAARRAASGASATRTTAGGSTGTRRPGEYAETAREWAQAPPLGGPRRSSSSRSGPPRSRTGTGPSSRPPGGSSTSSRCTSTGTAARTCITRRSPAPGRRARHRGHLGDVPGRPTLASACRGPRGSPLTSGTSGRGRTAATRS